MRRVTPYLVPILLGFMTMFALPQTRWLLLNQIDAVTSNTSSLYGFEMIQNSSGSTNLTKRERELVAFRNLASSDPKVQLGRAMTLVDNFHSSDTDRERNRKFEPIEAYIKTHPNDFVALAYFACLSNNALSLPDPQQKSPAVKPVLDPLHERTTIVRAQRLERVSRLGESAEPTNAFFPLQRAVALLRLGKTHEAMEAFESASQKSDYKEHAFEACQAKVAAFEAVKGYRGEGSRLAGYASYLFPNLASYKPTAAILVDEYGLRARIATMRISQLIMHKSDVSIDVFVGRALQPIALLERRFDDKGKRFKIDNPKELSSEIDRLDSQLGAGRHDFTEIVKATGNLSKPSEISPIFDESQWWLTATPLFTRIGGASLLSVILVGPLVGLVALAAKLKTNSLPIRVAIPYVSFLIAVLTPDGQSASTLVAIACAGLILIPSSIFLSGKYPLYTRIGGYILAVIAGVFGSLVAPLAGVLSVWFILSDLTTHWRPVNRYGNAIYSVFFVLLLVFGTNYNAYHLAEFPLGIFLSLLFLISITPQWNPMPRYLLPLAIILSATAYLGSTGYSIYTDQQLKLSNSGWVKEADRVRTSLGVKV